VARNIFLEFRSVLCRRQFRFAERDEEARLSLRMPTVPRFAGFCALEGTGTMRDPRFEQELSFGSAGGVSIHRAASFTTSPPPIIALLHRRRMEELCATGSHVAFALSPAAAHQLGVSLLRAAHSYQRGRIMP
jgi:hypothetical protein